MRIRLMFAAAATLALAACSESTTAPRSPSPGARASDVLECRSGYHIATRSDGSEYCAPDDASMTAATPTTSGS